MGDEVTKKDLQSLQGYCNKQIGDVNKRIDNACKAVNDVAHRMEAGDSEADKRLKALEARVAALEK